MTQPIVVIDQHRHHEEHWHCTPPSLDAIYVVLRDEWNAEQTIRRIYAIKVVAS